MTIVKKLFPLLMIAMIALFAAACEKDNAILNDQALEQTPGLNTQKGYLGVVSTRNDDPATANTEEDCLTINYPVTVVFPDGTTQDVNSDDELETLADDWFENEAEDSEEYPMVQFPITVTLTDGTTQDLADEDALFVLLDDCYGEDWDEDDDEEEDCECDDDDDGDYDDEWGAEDLSDLGECFTINYPVTIVVDGMDNAIGSNEELAAFLMANEDVDFEIVYPIMVTLTEDGSMESVEDDEDLEDLLEDCFGDDYDEEDWDDCDELDDFSDCFTFVYPFSVTLGEETISIGSDEDLNAAFDRLEDEDEDVDVELVYPISVVLTSDNTTVMVNSDEELDEIWDSCE